jgi:tRNA nucleotidyltransferase (CCA-adding enzyme)
MSHRTIRRPAPPKSLRTARFPAVRHVLEVLDGAGHRSWIVGGAVRDVLLRRPRGAADLDIATPARPPQVVALFPRTIPTGLEHGTVTVLARGEKFEVTTFRGEGAYLDGRRPSQVTFLDDLDGDLARRDFTVNAMAWDPIGQVFRDPFGGRGDLRRRLLRAVGDPAARFAEDGLRPLRAARFAAQLGFSIAPATAAAIPGALPTVRKVAVERMTDEFGRLLVAREARRGLELLRRTGLLEVLLPGLPAVGQRRLAHAFDVAGAAPAQLSLRLAALLHVLPGAAGGNASRVAGPVLARLRFPGAVRDQALALLADHRCLAPRRPTPLPADDVEARRWLARVGDRREALQSLADAELRASGATGKARRHRTELAAFARRTRRVLEGHPALEASELALDGRAVMDILSVPGGPAVGAALRHLLDRVLMEPRMNTRERLASELQRWWAAQVASGATAPRR